MGFNPLGIVKKLIGGGPLVKAEGLADQIQDKQAERRFGLGWIILCSGIAIAMVIVAIKGC